MGGGGGSGERWVGVSELTYISILSTTKIAQLISSLTTVYRMLLLQIYIGLHAGVILARFNSSTKNTNSVGAD